MHIYTTRAFDKWAEKEGLSHAALITAVAEIEHGLVDADLGGHVVKKKRVALPGRGKSGGARTLLAWTLGDRAFFLYGFARTSATTLMTKS